MEKDRYSTYLQKYNYDCGAGAAGIVLKNLGEYVNHNNLMQALHVNRAGTWNTTLEEYFKKRGFAVKCGENSSIAELKRESDKGRLPIVLFQGSGTKREMERFKSGHYAVVAGVTSRYVYLLDPGVSEDGGDGVGWQIVGISDFRNRWVDRWKSEGKYVYLYGWMLSVRKSRRYS